MNEKNRIVVRQYESPCGLMLLGSADDRLCLCDWRTGKHSDKVDGRLMRMWNAGFAEGTSEIIELAMNRLDGYFYDGRTEFDVPLLFIGTEFQKKVWAELMKIPYGTTVSYGEIARRIGLPAAVRAVANANGANPISVFAPCHRVVGRDGSLTGYGGGLDAKRYLLALENSVMSCGRYSEATYLTIQDGMP